LRCPKMLDRGSPNVRRFCRVVLWDPKKIDDHDHDMIELLCERRAKKEAGTIVLNRGTVLDSFPWDRSLGKGWIRGLYVLFAWGEPYVLPRMYIGI